MKYFILRQFMIGLTIILALPVAQAQFDDVYDKPVKAVSGKFSRNEEADPRYQVGDNLSSRANQNRPSTATGGYNPMSGGCNYNDPYGWNSYNYYSGSGFQYYPSYYSSWNSPYNPYNSWNNPSCAYPSGNNWYNAPASYYFSNNNNWYNPFDNSNNYGMGGCDVYSNNPNNYNGYNPYYPTTDWNENPTGTPANYYGPRISGNTGSSPRGPATNQSIIDPLSTDAKTSITPSSSNPNSLSEPASSRTTGRQSASSVESESSSETDETNITSRRPVFKPYEGKAPASSGTDRNSSGKNDPITGNASPRKPAEPATTNEMPSYTPPSRNIGSDTDSDRPSYTPPTRTNNAERNTDKPSNSPRSANNESERNNDKPSYTPAPRNDSQGDSNSRSGSSYTPSRSSSSGSNHSSGSNNSSSGSSRSSGGSSGGSSSSPSSPRGRG